MTLARFLVRNRSNSWRCQSLLPKTIFLKDSYPYIADYENSLRITPSGNIAVHCERHGCSPNFNSVNVVARLRVRLARNLIGVFHVKKTRSGILHHCNYLRSRHYGEAGRRQENKIKIRKKEKYHRWKRRAATP